MRLSVVIAAYNERETVDRLVPRLGAALRAMRGVTSEVIFVVEGTDGTRERLEEMRDELPRLTVLYEERPSGLGAAFRRGFSAVDPRADLVVTMDADLNHQPEEIAGLLSALRKRRADIVVGSRFVAGAQRQGIPAWKSLLSQSVNLAMRVVFDLRVRDKTSGFRVYRAEALRRLAFRNDDFAFLPEILVAASSRGMVIVEEPIHFIFRTEGRSKMGIGRTSLSYLRLFRQRLDVWNTSAAVLILLGTAVRGAALLLADKFLPDADALLTGIQALHIMAGERPIFCQPPRLGALESYLHAIVFSVFGPSRSALAVVPTLAAFLFLVAFFLLIRSLAGRRAATIALAVAAFPPAQLLFWTHLPNSYGETLVLGTVTLWLADGFGRRAGSAFAAAGFGLAAGLGIWQSFQTLECLLPAAAWILFWRLRDVFRPRFALAIGSGLLAGAAPWILFNVRTAGGSFHGHYATVPVGSAHLLFENVSFLLRTGIPHFLLSSYGFEGTTPLRGFLIRHLRLPVLGLELAAFAWLMVVLARRGRGRESASPYPGGLFLLGTAFVAVGLLVVSQAGSLRAETDRFYMFVFPLLALALGVFVVDTARRSRLVAAAALSAVVLFNAAGYPFPGTVLHAQLKQAAQDDAAVISTLSGRGIEAVCGSYWLVYPFTFLTRSALLGVPDRPDIDFYGAAGRLPIRPLRWALVGASPEELRAWASRAGVRGRTLRVTDRRFLFLPEENPPPGSPQEFARRLQQSHPYREGG